MTPVDAWSVTVKTRGGRVNAHRQRRVSGAFHSNREWEQIVGESPAGAWTAFPHDNGTHGYNYPPDASPTLRSAVRRTVAKLLAAEDALSADDQARYRRHLAENAKAAR